MTCLRSRHDLESEVTRHLLDSRLARKFGVSCRILSVLLKLYPNDAAALMLDVVK